MVDNDTRPTMADRIKEYGITVTAQRIAARPDRPATDWDKDATHFLVTLVREGRTLVTPYSMGSAHLDRYVLEQAKKKHHWGQITYTELQKAVNGNRAIYYVDGLKKAREFYGKDFKPEAVSVLDSLALDARCTEGQDFEEFCGEMGYDTDSRKAEETFNACRKIRDDLRRFMGTRAAFEDLIFNTEGE